MKKITVYVFLIALCFVVGIYEAHALTNSDIQAIINALSGASVPLTSNQIEILNGLSSNQSSNTGGVQTYSVKVDYSKSISDLLTTLNIPNTSRSDEFNLNPTMFDDSKTGQVQLDFQIVSAKTLFSTDSSLYGQFTPNKTIDAVMQKMHELGYRPATLKEFLAAAIAYPELIPKSMNKAWGSIIKLSNPIGVNNAVRTINYSYYYPSVFSQTYSAGNYGPRTFILNGLETDSSGKIVASVPNTFFVVKDSVNSGAIISRNSLPTQSIKNSSGNYAVLTGEKYTVTVDYSKSYSSIAAADTVSAPNSGSQNIEIELAAIRGGGRLTRENIMSILSTTFPNYRFATARELSSLNEAYKDKFDGVAAFGSYNTKCNGYPVIFKNQHLVPGRATNGTTGGSGSTVYSDKRFVDALDCTMPGEWVGDGKKHSITELPNYSSCSTTNIDTLQWKFALVKKN